MKLLVHPSYWSPPIADSAPFLRSAGVVSTGCSWRNRFISVLSIVSTVTDLDLISYLKAIPDARIRRGVAFRPGISCWLRCLGSLAAARAFSIWNALSSATTARSQQLWVLSSGGRPQIQLFRYFFQHVDVAALCALRDLTIAQIQVGTADLDQFICGCKTLLGSIDATASGGRFHCPGDALLGSPGTGYQ